MLLPVGVLAGNGAQQAGGSQRVEYGAKRVGQRPDFVAGQPLPNDIGKARPDGEYPRTMREQLRGGAEG